MKQNNISAQELGGTACIITGGLFDTVHAKTAHGLIRESKRFEIIGVIDAKSAGKDAGHLLDGKSRNIPVVERISSLIESTGQKPEFAVIGMATKGGVLPESLYPLVEEALLQGINLVNGLHQPLSEMERFQKAAEKGEAFIYDIRKPKSFADLHFWSGKILEVPCLKIGVLGTDCSTGKRTTAKLLNQALTEAGIKSEMIFTGQTGWLQGGKYGFVLDATPNDFIPGELEHAIYTCWKEQQPDVILVEGQASLRNPSGPCGGEFIISGRLDGVILQHHPVREKYSNLEAYPATIHDVIDEVDLIKKLGAPTWAITLNTGRMNSEQIQEYKADYQQRGNIDVICPMEDGLEGLVKIVNEQLTGVKSAINE
ncbi:DUF1611 domain-containing protein [Rapidithrix thailandica]|uniref:DUF1611 domain-containing protein n=1 Tax=Rapidithrix thailandica TaxID=413964 RepID=A0AAW9S4W1_9BACT